MTNCILFQFLTLQQSVQLSRDLIQMNATSLIYIITQFNNRHCTNVLLEQKKRLFHVLLFFIQNSLYFICLLRILSLDIKVSLTMFLWAIRPFSFASILNCLRMTFIFIFPVDVDEVEKPAIHSLFVQTISWSFVLLWCGAPIQFIPPCL